MSALPVVRCGIPLRRMAMGGPASVANEVRVDLGDLPALAVPDSLWRDVEFQSAVMRAWKSRLGSDLFAAIHAELRARAAVPETDFGNPKDGAA